MALSLMQRQADLFPPPAPVPHLSHQDRMWAIASSAEVRAEILSVFAARPGEWLEWRDFRSIMDRHKISSYFGHVLFWLVQEEKIIEQLRYFGSENPGDGNYLGYGSRWGSIGTEGPRVLVGVCNGR